MSKTNFHFKDLSSQVEQNSKILSDYPCQVHGSMLIGQANQVQKIGLNSSLNYDQGHDERGILFEVSSSWGQTDTEIQDSLWTENSLNSANSSELYSNDTKLNTELGYGLNILDNGSSCYSIHWI